MQLLNVADLIPHKKNEYFFDNMSGEPWMAFLDSIKTSGVIEPVIATQDLVIVSGHQRVNACKALGIKQVWTDIRTYDSEDEILKQLIETNIRQRGVGNTNSVKLGRCIAELERIYGIKNGGDRKSDGHNVQLKSQDDLAKELDMSKKQMSRYKSLTDLIPELQDAVMSGKITATTAMGFVKKLSPEEQMQIAEQIAGNDDVSTADIKKYIDEIKAVKEENAKLRAAHSEQGVKIAELNRKLEGRAPSRVEVKEVEVIPADYNAVKAKAIEADSWKSDYEKEQKKVAEKNEEIAALNTKMDTIKMDEAAKSLAAQCYALAHIFDIYKGIIDNIERLSDESRDHLLREIKRINGITETFIFEISQGERDGGDTEGDRCVSP